MGRMSLKRSWRGTGPLWVCLLVLSWVGCRPEDWDLGAPEVLRVSESDLLTTPAQGTAEHKVEEVWVYSATDVVGVYPLPATVALPAGEPQTLTLVPGIRANAVSYTHLTLPTSR